MHTQKDAPILHYIRQAIAAHYAKYSFHAERLHASPMMEGALVRWAEANLHYPQDINHRLQGAEIFGLQIVRMTKKSALVEFYLSTERDGQVFASHAMLEPENVGVIKATGGDIIMETNPADFED